MAKYTVANSTTARSTDLARRSIQMDPYSVAYGRQANLTRNLNNKMVSS